MGEDAMAVELAALDEGEGAGAAERSGAVGLAAPDVFKLDMVPISLQCGPDSSHGPKVSELGL
jgi:hypothetical protein